MGFPCNLRRVLLYYGYSIFFFKLIKFSVPTWVILCDKKSINYYIKITRNKNNTWFVDFKEVLILFLKFKKKCRLSFYGYHYYHLSLNTSHYKAQTSSQNVRACAVVLMQARCELATLRAPWSFFSGVCGIEFSFIVFIGIHCSEIFWQML